jgi:hypothetical protein
MMVSAMTSKTKLVWIPALFAAFCAMPAYGQTACGVTATSDIATKIANGHSWTKHQSEYIAGNIIAGLAMPSTPKVTTSAEFKTHVQTAMGSATNKALTNGRKAWWYALSGTIVIFDPNNVDCGTAFRPTLGKPYYDQQ